MNVFISYHTDDYPLMERWARHTAKLGVYGSHSIFIMPAHGAESDKIAAILKPAFSKVEVVSCYHDQRGWPISCNLAFEQAAWHSYNITKAPFLWMEPDAVPLKGSWIDDIEAAYSSCGKPFMGDFVGIKNIMPNGIDHMSGVAVYPSNMPAYAGSAFNNETIAWDIASGRDVVPKMARTTLIHHDWIPEKKWRRDVVTPDCVKDGAVIYHPDKNGVLFADGETRVAGEPQTGAPVSVSSFEQSPSAPTYEDHKKETDWEEDLINQFKNILLNADSSRSLKRAIKSCLIESGWIKKSKSTKQPRKKVRSTVGEYQRAY